MPITLGCPSCGKRFRARDESAGKKVKCPYCQAAVPVPTAEESATAGAPTVPLPPPPAFEPPVAPPSRPAPPSRSAPPPRPTSAPPAPVVASPDDWGALPAAPAPTAPVPTAPARSFPVTPPPQPAPEPEPNPFPAAARRERGEKPRPKPAKPEPKKETPEKTPESVLAKRWAAVRRGLFWVQFSLLFFLLIGFAGFGRAVYVRSAGELPKGEGWIRIDGYINGDDPNAIPLSKAYELDLLTYILPICIGGFLLTIGRLFSSGGPRNSGAKGLFALSGLLTLLTFIALPVALVARKTPFPEVAQYAALAVLVCAPLAEFWFLTALTASGVALKRPKVARAVGFVGLTEFVAIAIAALVLVNQLASFAWDHYVREAQRPKPPGADWVMYEQAALAMGWVILIFSYWRAVRGVRVAAREFIDTVNDES